MTFPYPSGYPHITSVFLRSPAGDQKKPQKLEWGEWAAPWLEALVTAEWVATEKIHGTNVRLLWNRETEELEIRGRTDAALLTPKLAALHDELRERFLVVSAPTMAVYCEGFGPGINSGGGYRQDHGLVVFDVRPGAYWADRDTVRDTARDLGLPVVKEVGWGSLYDLTEAFTAPFPSAFQADPTRRQEAEGVVLRPVVELRQARGDRVIAKLKLRDVPLERRGS